MEHCKCTPYIQLAKFPDPIPTTLATITTTDADLPSSVGIILTSLQKLQPDHVLYYRVQTKVLMRLFMQLWTSYIDSNIKDTLQAK